MTTALALMLLAAPAEQCRTNPELGGRFCPLVLPARRRIVVERVGRQAWVDAHQTTPCHRFAPTPGVIARYLGRAERTDRGTLHYALSESGCFATGRIHFADGRTGRFRFDRFANMQLTIGRGPVIYLACERCAFAGLNHD